MASGFFLGGMADGMANADERALQERKFAADTSLRSRGLDIQQSQLDRQNQGQDQARYDKLIADNISVATELANNAIKAGVPPEKINQTITPLFETAKALGAKVGRDPAAFDAQKNAIIQGPSPIATASVAGAAEGAKQLSMTSTIAGSNTGMESYITDPNKRAETENKLRDDYQKNSNTFVTVRDFYDRMKNAAATGAGDLTLVFSFMKTLDPTSTVREGEYANAQNAAGIPEGIRGKLNRIIGEGNMSAQARKEMLAEGELIFKQAATRYNYMTKQVEGIAKRQGLNPKNVIVDVLNKHEQESFDEKWKATLPKGFVPEGK